MCNKGLVILSIFVIQSLFISFELFVTTGDSVQTNLSIKITALLIYIEMVILSSVLIRKIETFIDNSVNNSEDVVC